MSAATLAKEVYAACAAVNDIAELVSFIADTAKNYARDADEDTFSQFHRIQMALRGAEKLLLDQSEDLDVLSAKIGAVKGAAS